MREADAAPADGHRLVFAGGCPRSGLTLLRRLVEPHTLVHCGPDTGLPPSIAMQWQAFASQLGELHAREFYVGAEDMRRTMAELLRGLLEAPLEGNPKRILIEKTSLNVAAFEQLGALLPGARFVHVVRDGRDVAASLIERDWRDAAGTPFAHVSRPDAALKYWSDLAGIGLRAEAKLAGRVLRVRYEDLVRRPRSTLTALLAFLGLKFEPAMLHFAGRPVELKGLERDSLPLINRPLTQTRIGRGAQLDPLATAEVRARLDALGYGMAAPAKRRRRVRS